MVCGAVLSISLPPTGLWFLSLALIPLFALVAGTDRPRDAFGLGFFFGLSFFAVYIFWLPDSFADIFGPISWIIYVPIVLMCAAFWGIVTWASRVIGKRGTGTLWLLPAFWLMMEWARTQGPLAFPWGSLGYLWLGTPIAQAADIAGSYGLSFLTLVMAALVASPLIPPQENKGNVFGQSSSRSLLPWLGIPIAIVLGLGTFFYGNYRLQQTPTAPNQQALLVQGNTDPLGRAQGTSSDLEVYTRLSSEGVAQYPQVNFVVWPEGALLQSETGPLEGMQGETVRLQLEESTKGKTLISGAGIWEGNTSINLAYGFYDGQITDQFTKIYLVPFGEGLPFHSTLKPVYDFFYRLFGFGQSYEKARGKILNPITTPEITAAAYICYESVFPQVARSMVKRGAQVLINISNDAWFGVSSGAEQHFLMGTMRAIETRRYLLRAGNDGITAVVNPLGQVLERLERKIEGTLVGDYAITNGMTLYVRFGDWLMWVVLGYGVVVSFFLGFRRE
jgi:apolipoprotein N-acyltransferase